MNILFVLRKAGVNKVGTASIGCRITVEGKSTPVFSTGVRVKPKDWDAKNQKIKLKDTVSVLEQEELNAIVARLKAIRLDFENKGKVYSAVSIKSYFDGEGSKSEITFAVLIAKFREITERMPNKDSRAGKLCKIRKIESYAKANGFLNLLLGELKAPLFEKMLIDMKAENLSIAHITKHLTVTREMLTLGQKLGFLDRNPTEFVKFEKIPTKKIIYLTQKEIEDLETHVFDTERLTVIRDMFVLVIYSGFSFEDLKRLSSEDVVMGIDGREWFDLSRHKTDVEIKLPILEKTKAIITKYGGIDNLPIRSLKTHNEYLKEIQTLCKIKKTLTTHVARRTFCVMALNFWNVSLGVVAIMAGHKDEKTTKKHYTLILDEKVAHDMKNIK